MSFDYDGENNSAGAVDEVRWHIERGQAYLEMERVEEAVKEFARAASHAPDAARPQWYLSQCACIRHQWHDALRYAEAGIVNDPNGEWGHRLRSTALRALDRKLESLLAAVRAVELDPEGELALYALLIAHLDSGHTNQAKQVLSRLQAVAPDSEDTHKAAAWLSSARGHYKDMEAATRRALAVNPESKAAFRLLGDTFWLQNNYAAAWQAYKEAYLLAPNDADLRKDLSARVTDRFFPATVVERRHLLNGIGAYSACWIGTVLTGQAFLGWMCAAAYLSVRTFRYALVSGMYLRHWRRKAWNEVPPDAQAFLWRARLLEVRPAYKRGIPIASLIVLIALACLCRGYPYNIAPHRGTTSKVIACIMLLVQIPLFCRGLRAATEARKMMEALGGLPLENGGTLLQTLPEAVKVDEAALPPVKSGEVPPPENPWAIAPSPRPGNNRK